MPVLFPAHQGATSGLSARLPAPPRTRLRQQMEPQNFEETSAELERLAVEQLNDDEGELEARRQRGRSRRARVRQLYQQGAVRTGEDYYHAALVMLHGDEIASLELARHMARRATELGEQRAWSVIATAWDRALIKRGLPQRFGTQFVRENGRLSLGPVDPSITDSQRALYGVPPLWVQQQTVERLRRREESDQ
jgi:hypothetical protein